MKIYQQESFILQMEIRTESGEPADLTNATVMLRLAPRGLPDVLEKTAAVISPGLVQVELTSADLAHPAGIYVQEWRVFQDNITTTVYRDEISICASLFAEV